MMKINLHGILAFEFGKEFNFYAENIFLALKALNTVKGNFLNRLKNLHKDGFSYSVIIDGQWVYDIKNFNSFKKAKQIDIVPNIYGANIWGAILGGILFAASAVFTGGASIGAALAMGVIFAGLSILSQALSKSKTETQKANTQFVGGQSSSSSGQSKNYSFSNTDNVATQNVPVPIGYGRMRIGTKIIQTSIKSYPTNRSVYEEFSQSNNPLNKSSLGLIP